MLFKDAPLPLREKVRYMDMDSVIYVYPSGEPLIDINHTSELGLWSKIRDIALIIRALVQA